MTMNPHTTASQLRKESVAAKPVAGGAQAAAKPSQRNLAPAALLSAGFILAVSLVAKLFYD